MIDLEPKPLVHKGNCSGNSCCPYGWSTSIVHNNHGTIVTHEDKRTPAERRVDDLRQEIAAIELSETSKKVASLKARVWDLERSDMQLLRDLMNERIKETYDGDDE